MEITRRKVLFGLLGVKIFFDGHLHFKYIPWKIVFIQSWIDWDGKKWCIEFHTNTQTTFCEYDNKETWLTVLKFIK